MGKTNRVEKVKEALAWEACVIAHEGRLRSGQLEKIRGLRDELKRLSSVDAETLSFAGRSTALAARTAESGGRWYAEIEMNGRTFAALGDSLRECAEKLRAKCVQAGAL